MKFSTGLFTKSCLASVSFMECSESHILLQGIYKILLLFSPFSNDLENGSKSVRETFTKPRVSWDLPQSNTYIT